MSRATDDVRAVPAPMAAWYAPVAEEMEQVDDVLRREMRNDDPYVDELVRYGGTLGGKRLRPALLLLTAKAVGSVTGEHLILAAVVEMIHTATLVHDDLLDEATVRRHRATVNARWDADASVLLGDFLFSHAFYLASTLDSTMACRLIGRATNVVCAGEIRQKGSRHRFQLAEEEYLQILGAKTGELCACCCQLGAHFAGASPSLTGQLADYGRYLGIAFQIADDLLDVTGDERTVGKSLGSDLDQQKPTLPLIRALQVADRTRHRRILEILEADRACRHAELRRHFEELGTVDYTRRKARQFVGQALEQLESLPNSPPESSLRALAEFAADRSH